MKMSQWVVDEIVDCHIKEDKLRRMRDFSFSEADLRIRDELDALAARREKLMNPTPTPIIERIEYLGGGGSYKVTGFDYGI